MATTYRTMQGDMVDEICFRHYGRTAELVEMVLEGNPGLAAKGPKLSAGLIIILPDAPSPARTAQVVKLWD